MSPKKHLTVEIALFILQMFSCYSELSETPIFYLEQVDVSSCLLLLEDKLEKKKTPAEWKKASFCLCLRQNPVCTYVCVCVKLCELHLPRWK